MKCKLRKSFIKSKDVCALSFKDISHSSIERVEYIVSASPTKRSRKSARNKYFDIEDNHSLTDKKEVRVKVSKGFPII